MNSVPVNKFQFIKYIKTGNRVSFIEHPVNHLKVVITQKSVNWFALQFNWLVSFYIMTTWAFNELFIFAKSFILDLYLGFDYGSANLKTFKKTYFEATYLISQYISVSTQHWVKYVTIMVSADTYFLVLGQNSTLTLENTDQWKHPYSCMFYIV